MLAVVAVVAGHEEEHKALQNDFRGVLKEVCKREGLATVPKKISAALFRRALHTVLGQGLIERVQKNIVERFDEETRLTLLREASERSETKAKDARRKYVIKKTARKWHNTALDSRFQAWKFHAQNSAAIAAACRRGERFYRDKYGTKALTRLKQYAGRKKEERRLSAKASIRWALHIQKRVFNRLRRSLVASGKVSALARKEQLAMVTSGAKQMLRIWKRWLARRSKNNIEWALWTWRSQTMALRKLEAAAQYFDFGLLKRTFQIFCERTKAQVADRRQSRMEKNQRQIAFIKTYEKAEAEVEAQREKRERLERLRQEEEEARREVERRKERAWKQRRKIAKKAVETRLLLQIQAEERAKRRKEIDDKAYRTFDAQWDELDMMCAEDVRVTTVKYLKTVNGQAKISKMIETILDKVHNNLRGPKERRELLGRLSLCFASLSLWYRLSSLKSP